ncbi:MAG TPA: biosynthetic peptidoglycan transglycosylase [Candidatus Sulfotelmatobacter sp.]|nr:biosynthetic peptidoglycan transglycosylase [Candidatus Sulfotelmatobacter sp.]
MLLAAAVALGPFALGAAIRHAAGKRGLIARFDRPQLTVAFGARIRDLRLIRVSSGDTLLAADSLELRLSPLRLLVLQLAPAGVRLTHARIELPAPRESGQDSLGEEETGSKRNARPDRSGRLRALADQLVRALLLPARTLPSLELRDVHVRRASADDTLEVDIERLALSAKSAGAALAAKGRLGAAGAVPFAGRLHYGRDDRLTGAFRFELPDPGGSRAWPLEFGVDGRVTQDRRAGRIEIREPTTLRVGRIAMRLAATLDRRGPALDLRLAADSLTESRLKASLPPPVLGPLEEVGARGGWDYRLRFQLDLARPDSVEFAAGVIPHGLSLDPDRTRLNLLTLDQPFVATIHLPHRRLVTRDLSPANPHFRALDRIDSTLAHAVVTNEDGGFFRHRGFNPEAIRNSIAENIRAAAYRRGAGTITMQVARNLWLGHDRTLARKAQEVILAWVLEHLTGVSKQRLLEIYLNVIEWGPDVHGADEAARYFLGHDAGRMSVDEALFLTTVIPSPLKWRWRFEKDGSLRQFEREQMHFIGRAMIARGWLAPEALPPVEALRVELRGPAREVIFPPAADSVGAGQAGRPAS